MAVLGRLDLSQLIDAIRYHLQSPDTALSDIADTVAGAGPSAKYSLGEAINIYLQGLRGKMETQIRSEGISIHEGTICLPFYRTSGTLTEASGSATVWFPTDFDTPISFEDQTDKKPLFEVKNPTRFFYECSNALPPGPPEWIVIEGFHDNSGTWQRRGKLFPAPPSGVTPDIAIEYFRVPADIDESSGSSVPDIDPRFQEVLIYGVTAALMLTDHPRYHEMRQRELELLHAMAKEATIV